ncbi:MAG: SAM-dependent methyltransferase, partial [Actinomycetota bacterium]
MAQLVDQTLEEKAGAFVERAFGGLMGALDLYLIDLGVRLGLYAELREGPATSAELAGRAGCDERYIREWLEQQAIAGVLDVDDPSGAPIERRYSIPEAHLESLLNPDSPLYVGVLANCATIVARPVEWMVEAFRTGDGVPYERYGQEGVELQAGLSRPMYS